jgi:hypothetical protein
VTLSDVYFGARGGTTISTTANDQFTITNSMGQSFSLSFFDYDLDTAGQTLPNYAYTVTGVLYGMGTNSYYSVAVTRFADINTNAAVVVTPIPLSLSVSNGNFNFNWTNSSFSLQSSTNVAGPYTSITGASTGFSTNTASGPTMFYRLYHP